MLIYANYLDLIGPGARQATLKALGGWLKEQLGRPLRQEDLLRKGSHPGLRQSINARGQEVKLRSLLQIQAVDHQEPMLYSWRLQNDDDRVPGRQWVTEVGMQQQGDRLRLSIAVKTEDHNIKAGQSETLVAPPRLVRYLFQNVRGANDVDFDAGMEAVELRSLSASSNAYVDLLAEMERGSRRAPLVLVSAKDGNYLVHCEELQTKLLGIAQVVKLPANGNSYEMAEILGEHRSAWSGAINLIAAPNAEGRVRTQWFLSRDIESWGEEPSTRAQEIIQHITKWTNYPKSLQHIQPQAVERLALQRALQLRIGNANHANQQAIGEYEAVLALADKETSELKNENGRLKADNDSLQEEIAELRAERHADAGKIASLEAARNAHSADAEVLQSLDQIVQHMQSVDYPRPEQCLELISLAYGSRCVVLPSAMESAREAKAFQYSRQLLKLLRCLVVDYRDALIRSGDTEARKLFGKNDFAAVESETVMNSPRLRRLRVFEYEGEAIPMYSHLKIGVNDDRSKTIRVHFHWDAVREKIVIGYCGSHLPISSR